MATPTGQAKQAKGDLLVGAHRLSEASPARDGRSPVLGLRAETIDTATDPACLPRGSCYGFAVRSRLDFRFLRHEDAGDPLMVIESRVDACRDDDPVLEWLPSPDRDLHACVYHDRTGFSFWTDREGWFGIDPEAASIVVPPCGDHVRREERLWGLPAAVCFSQRGDLPIHAAAVEVNDIAVVLAAPGYFGKTTLAGAFLRAGHRVLSEDFSCCRVAPVPAVVPGPALLRVRRDVYHRLEWPGTQVVADDPNRTHLAIDDSLRGDGRPVPLGAVLFLQSSERLSLRSVPFEEAVSNLWALTFKLPGDRDRARCFEGIVSIAASVPVLRLERPLRIEILADVVSCIIAEVGSG